MGSEGVLDNTARAEISSSVRTYRFYQGTCPRLFSNSVLNMSQNRSKIQGINKDLWTMVVIDLLHFNVALRIWTGRRWTFLGVSIQH